MTALSNLLRYIAPTNLTSSIHFRQHRRLTHRHVLFTLLLSGVLCTLYYIYLRRHEAFFSTRDIDFLAEPPEVWAKRAAEVKEAFRHAYRGYEEHAFPHDELLPVSNGSVNNFNGWSLTAMDSLDTMLLMGLEDEYKRALPTIRQTNFSLPSNERVPFFETVIRYLGGMLAAYALSGDDLLREKADELGNILTPAFNTTSGFPGFAVNTYGKKNPIFTTGVLAEIASCQMEYAYLGKITGKKEHVKHANVITDLFYAANLNATGGMYPTQWNLFTGLPSDHRLSVGALADSGHEYTLKQFLMTARTDKRNLEMYLRFTSYVINNLLFLSPTRHLLYVTDGTKLKRYFNPSHMFEHLSCFFPGLLALGVHLLPLDRPDKLRALGIDVDSLANDLLPADRAAYTNLVSEFNLADLHLWAAEGIAQTCYLTYADQPSGLGPETIKMVVDKGVQWVDALRAWNAGEQWWEIDGLTPGPQNRSEPRHGPRKGWLWDRDWVWDWVWGGKERHGAPPGVGDVLPWSNPDPEHLTFERPTVRPTRVKGKNPDTHGRDYLIKTPAYYLRPETIESFYILWRTTGNAKWRRRGWEIFQAIQRNTKTDSGYASVDAVHTKRPTRLDSMPSYFLAETLKYLYLLFSDEDLIPLEKWVFNTEAHPLPVFEWTREERAAYGIVA